ncbi:hypothetical protein OVA03_16425 [Asticcacaulis sp. SL142]|uniref:hypothetical protein n=1 Tax=Asticcacaulis sp. SL142 TaxID=2995155 RepID=UPI00226C9D4B|nr:hypothetical protein [Asticcacaulis sp. SL142]WAC48253.1 hypothetical protein OVA03_16425 [Asticcacaulis sp. SL142]
MDALEVPKLDDIVKTIHPCEQNIFVEDIGVMRHGQEPPPRIYRLVGHHTPMRYVSLAFTPVTDEVGNVRKFFGLARDVSVDEVRARHKDQNARRIGVLMDYFGVECIWNTDKSGQLFEHFTTGGLESIIPHFDPLRPSSIHPDDREAVLAEIASALEGDEPFSISMRILGVDGLARKYVKKGLPLRRQDRVVEWWGLIIKEKELLALTSTEMDHAIEAANGTNLRALCALAGWTHDELAKNTGISRTTIYRMVSVSGGLQAHFKRKTIEAVLNIFVQHGVRFHRAPDGKLAFSWLSANDYPNTNISPSLNGP